MSKIKSIEHETRIVARALELGGMMLMATAALTGIGELSAYTGRVHQPARSEFAYVTPVVASNPMLREREEAGPHFITYSANRTEERSGTL